MGGDTWAGGTPTRAPRRKQRRALGEPSDPAAEPSGGVQGASLAALRSAGGGVDAVPLPYSVASQAPLPPARKVQMPLSPALSNAHVQLRGTSGGRLVILILNYLMLGHNPTHSHIAPVCCNM